MADSEDRRRRFSESDESDFKAIFEDTTMGKRMGMQV